MKNPRIKRKNDLDPLFGFSSQDFDRASSHCSRISGSLLNHLIHKGSSNPFLYFISHRSEDAQLLLLRAFCQSRISESLFESSWEHANFVHDLGIVAAELKHYFAMHKGNDQRAKPYIGHFLWHYSKSMDEFRRISEVLPFFISLGLLRMARLNIGPDDSSYIFREAVACLRAKH